MEGMMKYDRAFSREEGRLLAAALKARQFRRPLPPGMGERLQARIRAAEGGGARWWKVAASVAAVASFAAFAATVAVKFAGGEDKTAEPGAFAEAEEVAAEETFEEIFSEELAVLRKQEEEQAMNTRAVRGLAAGALVAATAFSVPSAQGAVRSSVFDDAVVWYRGALEAQSYFSNGPEGTFANNGAKTAKAFKSILHTANPSTAPAMSWSWGWGAETTLDSAPVVCPYAGCTLTGVTYANRPIPVKTNDWAEVTVGGNTSSQPILSHWKGPEYLNSGAWVSEATSAYTLVLRLRVDTPLNNLSGSDIGEGFAIFAESNYSWNGKTGVRISFAGSTLGTYRYPRIFFGNQTFNLTNAQVPFGNWIDLAVSVNGSSVTLVACAQGESGNTLESKTATLSDVNPALPGGGNTFRFFGPECSGGYTAVWTNGLKAASSSSGENGMRTQHFRGAVHQMAFWNRALTLDEIRMAWGEGRPNLVHVGVEGNGIAEFGADGAANQTSSVSNGGAWQLLNPTLTAENPTATISFTCPALWAGLPQYLRLPMASTSSSGAVTITLNGMSLGIANVYPNKTSLVYVEENKIISGANTLVLTRTSGDALVLDAVTLGGSWRFGETISSFANAPSTIDQFLFHPAGANDKLRDRTLNSSGVNGTEFRFYVPEDIVGKFRGEFATRVQNTGGSTFNFVFSVNGEDLGTYGLKGGNTYEIKVPDNNIVVGWNTFAWKCVAGWANIDWHKFTVLPPVKGLMIIIK